MVVSDEVCRQYVAGAFALREHQYLAAGTSAWEEKENPVFIGCQRPQQVQLQIIAKEHFQTCQDDYQ